MPKLHNSTHWLKCRQQICANGYDYHMACNILKKMPDGRLKVEVFGNRCWGGSRSRIRYVWPHRVVKRCAKNGKE